jgi:hypothetical protein
LKDALKHIKAHNLYEKKTKTKTGGAATIPISRMHQLTQTYAQQ